MAQGAGELESDGEAALEAIRAGMRETRAGLTRKIELLKRWFIPYSSFRSGARKTMPGKRSATSSTKSAKGSSESRQTSDKKTIAKQAATSKTGSSSPRKKTSRKKVVGAIVDKTTEVLGEMLTGAAIGAVTGAAERVDDQPTAVREDKEKRAIVAKSEKVAGAKASSRRRSTSKESGVVLGEMLSGAAVGAVTGAAKAVIPARDQTGKSRTKSK